MERKMRLHPDVVISVIAILFGIVLLAEIHSYPDDVKLFPRLFLVLFLLFMGITLVQGMLKTYSPEKYAASEWWCSFETIRNPLITGAFVVIYVALIGLVGFYIATAAYLLGAMYFFGARSWKVNLAVTAVMLVFCYLLFERALSVTLPVGTLLKGLLG